MEASSFPHDDLTQSIKTAIFHHGAEQPTESHIERTDPCMEKAQLGTRAPLRDTKIVAIDPPATPMRVPVMKYTAVRASFYMVDVGIGIRK